MELDLQDNFRHKGILSEKKSRRNMALILSWSTLSLHIAHLINRSYTDYSRLPYGLVSMFVSFSLTSARKGYICSHFFCTNLFVVELKLNHKFIFLTLLFTKRE